MNHLPKAFIIAILSVATVLAQSHVRVANDSVVVPSNSDDTRDGLGVVYGTRPCGGLGQLVEWRVESCDTTDSPCRFPADGELRRSELDFIPSEDIEQLGIRLILSVNGKEPKTIYENPILNSTVSGGEQYTKKNSAGVSENMQGKNITLQYILYRADEQKEIEICAEADFELV